MISIEPKEYLLIGGPADGRRISVGVSPLVISYDDTPDRADRNVIRELVQSRQWKRAVYHIERIVVDEVEFAVFRYDGITTEDTIRSLIEGYLRSDNP